MSIKEQKLTIETIKKCQRNWDLSKTVPEEHIKHFIDLAYNTPSKQYEAYYDLYVLTNKSLIQQLLDHTWGFTQSINKNTSTSEVPSISRNPQMGANIYFLWVKKHPETMRNFNLDGTKRSVNDKGRDGNSHYAIGVSAGIVAFCAAQLGYVTGFSKNHEHPEFPTFWNDCLNIPTSNSIGIGLGIGFPQESRKWNESDETELLVGYPEIQRIDVKKYDQVLYNSKNYKIEQNIEYHSFSEGVRDIKIFRFD